MPRPTLAQLCAAAPLPVLDRFVSNLLRMRQTAGTRAAYATARRVRAHRLTRPY